MSEASSTAPRRPWWRRAVDYLDPGRDGFLDRMARLAVVPLVVVVVGGCALLAVGARTQTGQFTTMYVLVELRAYDRALPIVQRLVREHPTGNWHYYRNEALILRAMGRIDESLAVYDAAVSAMPDLWWPHSHRCFYYALLAEPTAESMASCDRSLELSPNRLDTAYDRRGFARARIGDRAGAIADFEQALAIWKRDRSGDWRIRSRTRWLEDLRAGRDPLDAEELEHERGHY